MKLNPFYNRPTFLAIVYDYSLLFMPTAKLEGANYEGIYYFGNTRAASNTEALAGIFADALVARGVNVSKVSLREKNIQTCVGCDKCNSVTVSFGCVIKDDMQEIANEILASDLNKK